LIWAHPVRRQSEHFPDYAATIAKLEARGLLYPSFESRSEIAALVAAREREGDWPRDPDGVPLYPGNARKLPPAASTIVFMFIKAWRMRASSPSTSVLLCGSMPRMPAM